MRFAERLAEAAKRNNSLLCVGLDPDMRRFPEHFRSDPSAIIEFNKIIIESTIDLVCAYKPNLGFYMAYGPAGIEALIETRRMIGDTDAGDPGCQSWRLQRHLRGLRARLLWELDFDAVTVHPYMGLDGIEPFLCHEDRAAFILVRTSNPGSKMHAGYRSRRRPALSEGGGLGGRLERTVRHLWRGGRARPGRRIWPKSGGSARISRS